LLDEKIPAATVEKIIKENGGKLIENINLFDVYKGKQIPDGMKSMAYSIVFRAEDRTLTDQEVNKVMDKILSTLKESLNAKLRE